ncbi:MAG TPA: hypothetical protein PLA13_06350, partial [Microbacteriaceae bacterium]|nr:hypothetical protein [Microbacteriaceae bacterium]
VALVELLLIVQLVAAIIAPFAGNHIAGSALEFYTYLVGAILVPIGVTAFALLERSRWSTVVLGVGALAVAVMLARMQIIWSVPVG